MEEHREKAKCQGVVNKDGGQAKLQRQYAKEGSLEINREDQGERGRQSDARMMHTYGQKKRAAKRAVDKAKIWKRTYTVS